VAERACRWWPALAVALVVVVVDQVSKAIVRASIVPGERVSVIDGVLRLVHARNSGIAGGLLADQPIALVIGVSLVAIGVLVLVARMLGPRRWVWLPIGLILGGALGNLLDRFYAGAVTDFLVFARGGPANLADQAITLGVIALVIVAWRSPDQRLDRTDAGGEQDGQHHAAA
jgi:signal peptidase II